jgi:hypothetical protein
VKDFKRSARILISIGPRQTAYQDDYEVHLDNQVFGSVIAAVKYLREQLDMGVIEGRKFVMDLPLVD